MQIRSFGMTDVGRKRSANQDAYYIDEQIGFYVVADGVGGHAGGEVAATEAVEAVHGMLLDNRRTIEEFRKSTPNKEKAASICRLVESAVQSATYMVYGIAEQRPSCQGMGTTVSALLLAGAHGVTAQVGDTRIYGVRRGEAFQLTEDHTLANWQVREGVLTPEEAKRSPQKNIITRAVGSRDYVQVDTQIFSVLPGDRFLICSDGLHGYLSQEEIPAILDYGAESACKALIDLANDRGGKDNITAVVVEILD